MEAAKYRKQWHTEAGKQLGGITKPLKGGITQ